MHLILFLMFALTSTPRFEASTRQEKAPVLALDVRQLSLDHLIGQLPVVGCEGYHDEGHSTFVLHPAIEELRRRLGQGERMNDAQWERALLISEVFRFRRRWPADLPFAVSMHDPAWVYPAVVRAVPVDPSLKAIQAGALVHGDCGTYELSVQQAAEYQELGLLSKGSHRILLDVTVERGETTEERRFRDTHDPRDRPDKVNPPPGMLWQGRVAIEVEIVPSINDVIPPGHPSDVGDRLRHSLQRSQPSSANDKDPEPDVIVSFDAHASTFPELRDIALSLEMGLFRDGRELGRRWMLVTELFGSHPCALPKDRWFTAYVDFGRVHPSVPAGTDPLAGLEVRVHGVSRDVLHHWGAQSWWDGTLSVPLAELPIER